MQHGNSQKPCLLCSAEHPAHANENTCDRTPWLLHSNTAPTIPHTTATTGYDDIDQWCVASVHVGMYRVLERHTVCSWQLLRGLPLWRVAVPGAAV
jgi:hypothetical protein